MIEITQYKPINKGALKGSMNIKISKWGNFSIREILHFKKDDGAEWISFPSKEYEKDGKKQYYAYNAFEDNESRLAFQDKLLKALAVYLQSLAVYVDSESMKAIVYDVTKVGRENYTDELPF